MTTFALDICARLLRDGKRPVALTGAGMSAESGIPTFRDSDSGLWARWPPETLASPAGFLHDKALVWGWYTWRMANVANASPNAGHSALAKLERLRPDFAIITQNVDNLHERAGSRRIAHLHGGLFEHRCFACARRSEGYEVPADAISNPSLRVMPPTCTYCGGSVRPGVVWFGEMIPVGEWKQAETWIRESDLVLVVGTSGVVQPAASLVTLARSLGVPIVLIDPNETEHSPLADHHLRMTAGIALPALLERLGGM